MSEDHYFCQWNNWEEQSASWSAPKERLRIQHGPVRAVLESIMKCSINPGHVRMADLLMSAAHPDLLEVPVRFQIDHTWRPSIANYIINDDEIVIYRGGQTVRTALHEIVHAFTSPVIRQFEPHTPCDADGYLHWMCRLKDGELRQKNIFSERGVYANHNEQRDSIYNDWLAELRNKLWNYRFAKKILVQLADAYLTMIAHCGLEGLSGSVGAIGKPNSVFFRNRRDWYGLANLHEFVAEAFTNPAFQNALESVPTEHDSRSLEEQMIEAIDVARGFGAVGGYRMKKPRERTGWEAGERSEPETLKDQVIHIGIQLIRIRRPSCE